MASRKQQTKTAGTTSSVADKSKNAAVKKPANLAALRDHVDLLEKRLKTAQTSTRKSVQTLQASFEKLSNNRIAAHNTDTQGLAAHIDQVSTRIDARIAQTRTDMAHDLQLVMADPRFETLSSALTKANKRLSRLEQKQDADLAVLNDQIANLAISLAKDMDQRFAVETDAREQSNHAIQERLETIESQTGEAVQQIGDKIVDVSDTLLARSEELQNDIGEKSLLLGQNLEEHKSEIARRIEALEDDQRNMIPSLERRLVTLATRLDVLEDNGAMPSAIAANAAVQVEPITGISSGIRADSSLQTDVPDFVKTSVQGDAFSASGTQDLHAVKPPQNPYADASSGKNNMSGTDLPFSLQEYIPPASEKNAAMSSADIRQAVFNTAAEQMVDAPMGESQTTSQVSDDNPYSTQTVSEQNTAQFSLSDMEMSLGEISNGNTALNTALNKDVQFSDLPLTAPENTATPELPIAASDIAPPPFADGTQNSNDIVPVVDNSEIADEQSMLEARPGAIAPDKALGLKVSRAEKSKAKKQARAEMAHTKKLAKQIAKQDKAKAKLAKKSSVVQTEAQTVTRSLDQDALSAQYQSLGGKTEAAAKISKPLLPTGSLRTAAMMVGVSVVGLMAAKTVMPMLIGGDKDGSQAVSKTQEGSVNVTQADARPPQFDKMQAGTNADRSIAPTINTVEAIGNYTQDQQAPDLGPTGPNGAKSKQALSLEAAAANGEPIAQFQLGLSHLSAGREAEAVRLIRLASNQGQPAAQYRLGKLYETGMGVKADQNKAMGLLAKAAKNGNRIAMHDLGHYFATGAGGITDMKQASQWFAKAANRGVLDSQFNLGVLYQGDSGIPKDLVSAYMWYSVAGSQGDELARQRATVVERELSKLQLKAAKSKIKAFKPRQIDDAANGIFRNVPWVVSKKSAQTPSDISGLVAVKTAQNLLSTLGYDIGMADGDMGPRTRNAVIAFERANGLPRTGRINKALIDRLNLAAGV